MKKLEIKRLGMKVVSFGLLMAIFTTFSMVSLAASNAPVGELMVVGNASADSASVTVNGEPAQSGRTIFSPSTIKTSENAGAVVNLGKAGKIELGPNSSFTLSSDSNKVGGDLMAGTITVLNSASGVNVKTLAGETVSLNAGETANATSGATSKKAKPGPGGLAWGVWAAIIAGAAVVVIIVATHNNNNSPSR